MRPSLYGPRFSLVLPAVVVLAAAPGRIGRVGRCLAVAVGFALSLAMILHSDIQGILDALHLHRRRFMRHNTTSEAKLLLRRQS